MDKELDKVIDLYINEILDKRFEQTKNWIRPNNESDEELKALQRELYYPIMKPTLKAMLDYSIKGMVEYITKQPFMEVYFSKDDMKILKQRAEKLAEEKICY